MWEAKVEINPDYAEQLDEHLTEIGADRWHVYSEVHQRLALLTGYFEDEETARGAWQELRATMPSEVEVGALEFRSVDDQEWRDAYKDHFHAWQTGGLHWVPVWERETYHLPEGEDAVWLDPGMAFGTGNHETTRLCAERMIECAREWRSEGRDLSRMEVLDAGCGSGILAISAVKCGFGRVAGFDNDPVAVEISEENAELNEVSGRIEFYPGDLITGLSGRTADLVIANIQADVLCRFASELGAAIKPGGRLVLSGILAGELDEVRQVFEQVVPTAAISTRELGEWADLLAVLPEAPRA